MITLYKPGETWGLPSMSPFAVKLETYLRMTGIEYRTKGADFRKAPNGRVPYIESEGKILGDSTLIIEYLKKKFGDKLDTQLSREQKALAHAIESIFESRLYFSVAYMRWSQDHSYRYVHEFIRPFLPPVIGGAIMRRIRSSFMKELKIQGLAEHRLEDLIRFAKEDFSAISDLLGNKPFFLGGEPSSIDATAYGFLIQVLWTPWECPLKTHLRSLPNLVAYCERMKTLYWS
jgi:glutathione S-transferase